MLRTYMNDMLQLAAYSSLGFFVGVLSTLIYQKLISRKSLDIAKNILQRQLEIQQNVFDKSFSHLQNSMKEHAFNTLNKSTETLLQLSSGQLNSSQQAVSKELNVSREHINKEVHNMTSELNKLTNLILDIERNQQTKIGELGSLLTKTNEQNKSLMETTASISQVLSNSQTRGQWGERIADDILQLVGFIENINYKKQLTLPSGERPDFTFLLPKNLYLHMDVKFPMANYTKYLRSTIISEKEKYKKLFFIDIKNIIKDMSKRNYMDPQTTVSCSLIFIPHEQVYAFIQKESPDLFDQSLQNNIIPCSPMSLFAVLSIIRKSIDVFSIQQTSQDILKYLHNFKKQWQLYNKSFDSLGKKISDVEAEYQKLTSTRKNQLTTVVDKITKLQQPPKT